MRNLQILEYFAWDHLQNEDLRRVSRLVGELVDNLMDEFSEADDEIIAGLRKLLEAKDCFVRAKVTQLKKGKT